jgi:hypothetical protein
MLQRDSKVPFLVEDVGDAAGHAGSEVAAGHAEHDDRAAGHVLAAVIADAFDDRGRTRVADGKALAGDTGEESFALGRTVEDGVADDDVAAALATKTGVRTNDDPPPDRPLPT